MSQLKVVVLMVIAVGIVALDTQVRFSEAPPTSEIPDWVTHPSAINGFAASECVSANEGVGLNYLKSQAIALARASLAKQIDLGLKTIEKRLDQLKAGQPGASVGGDHDYVQRRYLVNHSLKASDPVNMGYVVLEGEQQSFCVRVVLSSVASQKLYDDWVERSGNTAMTEHRAELFAEFLGKKQ